MRYHRELDILILMLIFVLCRYWIVWRPARKLARKEAQRLSQDALNDYAAYLIEKHREPK